MRKKDSRLLLLILLIGTAVSLGFYFLWPSPPPPRSVPSVSMVRARSPEAQALVNKHLWLTSQQQEISQKKQEVENSFTSPQIGDSIWPKPKIKTANGGVDHSPDRNESNAFEDLNRYKKEYQLSNPDYLIQGQLADADRLQEYSVLYREEYARQFVENARRHGYKVDLDANYVVIRVTPIRSNGLDRNPSAENSGSGTQAQ